MALEEALVIDQLKHAIIDYRIDGTSMKQAIKDAKKFVEFPENDENDGSTTYFIGGRRK